MLTLPSNKIRRPALLAILVFHSPFSFGCECTKSIGSNFLNQVKNFDLVVLATFHDESNKITLEIDKIYKGQVDSNTVRVIRGGTDCNHWLLFEDGQTILIGLNKLSEKSEEFIANGCVTSALNATEGKVTALSKIDALPAVGRQRIGLFARTMKLRTIERRIIGDNEKSMWY